ncbi:septum formation initiator family protein [Streptomyces sp. NBC_00576]|uniref:septum formation initiator family protein n=1 Tax=Streptomyces sp. NBC_00576 TaxID=2903665 RepID=UPI002E813222|nr:septum formation initiator family protein [Streptomyces sp. NBC_00576]WUB75125.1 septum formation initiator family protein [Streptomyces sp. NBC_00576]
MSRNPELKGRAARLARLFPTGPGQAARTPFVLLVVFLLGGGLIGLLVLNSALSEGGFRLDDLQKDTKSLTDEEQALQRDVDAYAAPDALQRRARELGMVPGGDPAFLDPDGTVRGVPEAAEQAALRIPAVIPPVVIPPVVNAPASAPNPTPTPAATPTPTPEPTPTPTPTVPATPEQAPAATPTLPSTTPGR